MNKMNNFKNQKMTSRRDFIKKAAAAGILSSLPGSLLAQPNFSSFQNQPSDELIKAILLHLSYNMW
ncbi:MAG: twin-arginine translocation signal domain-containing protein, partial [Bacteroidota bacterium]